MLYSQYVILVKASEFLQIAPETDLQKWRNIQYYKFRRDISVVHYSVTNMEYNSSITQRYYIKHLMKRTKLQVSAYLKPSSGFDLNEFHLLLITYLILLSQSFKTCSYFPWIFFYNKFMLDKHFTAIIHTALYLYIYTLIFYNSAMK